MLILISSTVVIDVIIYEYTPLVNCLKKLLGVPWLLLLPLLLLDVFEGVGTVLCGGKSRVPPGVLREGVACEWLLLSLLGVGSGGKFLLLLLLFLFGVVIKIN